MATFPLIPNTPAIDVDFDDDSFSDTDEDIFPPTFDMDGSDVSDDDDNDDDESPMLTGDLARIAGLKSPGALFPVARLQPAPPVQQPALRLAVGQPALPRPATTLTIPRATLPQATLPQATLPQATLPQATLPQATVPPTGLRLAVAPTATIPKAVIPPSPNIPVLGGLSTRPTAPVLAAQTAPTAANVNEILTKMSGISVSTVTPPPEQVPVDINDLLKKEADETPEEFEARRRITLQLASIPDYKLNNTAAVVAGLMLMKKSKLGITYDADVESALTYLTSLLQRQ